MRYHAMIGGKERTIDVEPLSGTQYRVALDGSAPQVIDADRVEPQVLSLLSGGQSYEVNLEQDGDLLLASVRGATYQLELLDERKHRMQKARGGSIVSGPVVVRAPMPGKVVKILVEVGQEVAENQGLIIIEAMKMENELRSPKAGRVKEIKVQEGQTVESRAELVAVE